MRRLVASLLLRHLAYIPTHKTPAPILISSRSAPLQEPDWRAVARDYRARILSVREICALHGIGLTKLYNQVELQGWPKRQKNLRPTPLQQRKLETDMSQRLLGALVMKLTELENRMKSTTETSSAADCERDARTLNTLVRLFEKLKSNAEADASGDSKTVSSTNPTGQNKRDADCIRKDLTRRLTRLRCGSEVLSGGGSIES
jgi:hypothetical protein